MREFLSDDNQINLDNIDTILGYGLPNHLFFKFSWLHMCDVAIGSFTYLRTSTIKLYPGKLI